MNYAIAFVCVLLIGWALWHLFAQSNGRNYGSAATGRGVFERISGLTRYERASL